MTRWWRVGFWGMVVAWAVMVGSGVVSGQPNVINPTTLSFTPSPDHATGVTSYRAEWYAAGATAPMMSSDLGKPTPGSTGDISLPIASLIQPIGAGVGYTCKVVAVGPGGEAASDPSNPFDVAGPVRPASSVRLTRTASLPVR